MGKRERDEALAEFTSEAFSEMLEELLMDIVLQSHQEVLKSNAVCDICHTKCHAVHIPGQSNTSQPAGSFSKSTPSGDSKLGHADGSGPSTMANGNGKDGDNNLLCTNCDRKVAPNRYAPHLASCMGLPNARRGAARNATKTKISAEAGRSASPYIESELGNLSDDNKSPVKNKGKSKAKRTDEAEFSLSKKRPGSPSISPAKKPKKAKTANSPAARVKDAPGSPSSVYSLSLSANHTKTPSKLRDSSVLSSVKRERRSSSPDSGGTSPAPSLSTVASAPSLKSPRIPTTVPTKVKTKTASKPPPKPPSPPRLPPPVVRVVPEPDYLVDVEGEETGSSTDTDSD